MNSSSVPACAAQPRSARRASWRAQDLARRGDDRRAVLPLDVGQAQRRALEPRRAAQRVEVGLEHEVAVAALPARHLVAADGVHVDVDREQVVAALGAVADDRLQEPRGGQALALQAALHVGQGQQDGVDVACRDLGLQLVEGHGCATVPCRRRPWQLWSARHTNARARRHHRPPGARARPAGGRAAAARGRHHQPQLPPADGRRGPRAAPVRPRRRGAGDRPQHRGDRLAPRRRRAASPRRSSPS